jgi:hypothetical protein
MPVEYRSPRTLSYLAIAGIAGSGICRFLVIIVGVALIVDPTRTSNVPSGQRAYLWVFLHDVIVLFEFPVYVFAIVVFLMWLFRIYKNLPALRAERVDNSPGWAVGWWFIPFINLVKPVQVVREAWTASDPDVDFEMSFLTAVQGGAPGYMVLWWAAWIISNVLANITTAIFNAGRPDTFVISGYFFVADGIATAIAAVVAIKVIRDITNRQELRYKRVGELHDYGPPPPPAFDQDRV